MSAILILAGFIWCGWNRRSAGGPVMMLIGGALLVIEGGLS